MLKALAQNAPKLAENAPAAPHAGGEAGNEELARFDLNFKGGSPQQLVDAIETAGVPVNVIIPNGAGAGIVIPPLKMRYVNVPQLFQALEVASRNSQTTSQQPNPLAMMDPRMLERYFGLKINNNPGITNGSINALSFGGHYGFRTEGTPANDSIWYFYKESSDAPREQRICRYFQLESYLTKYTIDDITTAVETGWKMLGIKNAAQLNFHKETKLLIAVGEAQSMNMIEEVLAQLDKGLVQAHSFDGTSLKGAGRSFENGANATSNEESKSAPARAGEKP
jgi:hypothetical protein